MRSRNDLHVPDRRFGRHLAEGAAGICAACYRTDADPHSPYFDPGHQHLGESGPFDGRGAVPGHMGRAAALGFLAGTHRRRRAGRPGAALAGTKIDDLVRHRLRLGAARSSMRADA